MSKATDGLDETTSKATTQGLLLAMLTLMIDERERNMQNNTGMVKTELLLAAAGLDRHQIAAMMNKTPDAVRKMIARNAQAAKKLAAKTPEAE